MEASYTSYALSQYVYVTSMFELPSESSSLRKYGTTTAEISDRWDPPARDTHTYGARADTYASVMYN